QPGSVIASKRIVIEYAPHNPRGEHMTKRDLPVMKLAAASVVAAVCVITLFGLQSSFAQTSPEPITVRGCLQGEGTNDSPWMLANAALPAPPAAAPAGGGGGGRGGGGRGGAGGPGAGAAPGGGAPPAGAAAGGGGGGRGGRGGGGGGAAAA